MSSQHNENVSRGSESPTSPLIITQAKMDRKLLNPLLWACMNRNTESALYPLLSFILFVKTLVVDDCNDNLELIPCPQPLFGTPYTPVGSEPLPEHRRQEIESLPGPRIPDFSRLVLPCGSNGRIFHVRNNVRDRLVDFFEVKALNSKHSWWYNTPETTLLALKVLEAGMKQVHDTAMAGFAHNSRWEQICANVVVGPFLTQVLWSSRPQGEVLKLLGTGRRPEGATEMERQPNGQSIVKLLVHLSKLEAQQVPAASNVTVFNKPMLKYDSSVEKVPPGRVWLSDEFLHALDRPTKSNFQPTGNLATLMAPPNRKPAEKSKIFARKFIYNAIVTKHVQETKSELRSKGYLFPGEQPTPSPSAPSTPTDSTYAPTDSDLSYGSLPAIDD